ncbi:CIA30 family protein [Rhodopseudomonas palustris]|uniref:NADH:ubiquinone oxidoreductase intermediate-associated protein 30 domain-containing protein n=1 Tax=Rhodopseudomonas palustris (strain BisB18) TaxID=316056 RepID=Q219X8_RHOPB
MTDLELWPADGTRNWQLITDAVMGGISRGAIAEEIVDGRAAVRMRGAVSTDNNGGFIQIALDLAAAGAMIDASGFEGIALDVAGNGESYGVHLRTPDVSRPQQSWRQGFVATREWQTILLPFAQFVPHRIDIALDPSRLRRIGLVAIGREFDADLSVARLALYGSTTA